MANVYWLKYCVLMIYCVLNNITFKIFLKEHIFRRAHVIVEEMMQMILLWILSFMDGQYSVSVLCQYIQKNTLYITEL